MLDRLSVNYCSLHLWIILMKVIANKKYCLSRYNNITILDPTILTSCNQLNYLSKRNQGRSCETNFRGSLKFEPSKKLFSLNSLLFVVPKLNYILIYITFYVLLYYNI